MSGIKIHYKGKILSGFGLIEIEGIFDDIYNKAIELMVAEISTWNLKPSIPVVCAKFFYIHIVVYACYLVPGLLFCRFFVNINKGYIFWLGFE